MGKVDHPAQEGNACRDAGASDAAGMLTLLSRQVGANRSLNNKLQEMAGREPARRTPRLSRSAQAAG